MIQSVQLKNFQNHEDTELVFTPGVNILIGKSDSGKSAVIRAMRWVIDNKPQGDGFRSHWGGDTSVSLQMEDTQVTRVRTASKNEYHLKNMVFKAMGNSIPDEVNALISMDAVNSQFQIDLPFLFSESPGEVARYFNRIAGLAKIDSSLKEVQSRINTENRKVTHLTEDLESQELEIKKYDNLPTLQAFYEKLLSKGEKNERLSNKIQGISTTITEITTVQTSLSRLPDTKKLNTLYAPLSEKMKEKKEIANKINTVESQITELRGVRADITQANKLISKDTKVTELLQKTTEIKQKTEEIDSLSDIISDIVEIRERIETGKMYNKALRDAYTELLPDVCPLCGTEIRHKK